MPRSNLEIDITRADRAPDSEQAPILREEWLALIENDEELQLTEADEYCVLAHWVTHTAYGETPWFQWGEDGCISVPLTDRKTLGKALAIAQQLGAKALTGKTQYHSIDDFPGFPSTAPASPDHILSALSWCFPSDAPEDREAFDEFVWQYMYERENDMPWEPDLPVLASPSIRVSYRGVRNGESIEDVVTLTNNDGKAFTAGELLYQLHRAVAADLDETDHHYFEGLDLAHNQDESLPALYYLSLGS